MMEHPRRLFFAFSKVNNRLIIMPAELSTFRPLLSGHRIRGTPACQIWSDTSRPLESNRGLYSHVFEYNKIMTCCLAFKK